jgi:hypothetical protein
MKATVTWDGDSWVGVLDEGGVTRSDRLELLLERLPELAQLMTGHTVPASEIELRMASVSVSSTLDEPGEQAPP